jgi:hypothetical protein
MAFLFVATADKTVVNTTTETTLFPSTITLAPADFVVGTSFRTSVRFYYHTTGTAPTCRFRGYLGSTTVWDTDFGGTVLTPPLATTRSLYAELDVLTTLRVIGASPTGRCTSQGRLMFFDSAAGTGAVSGYQFIQNNGVVIDTTAASTLDITATFGTAHTSNSCTVTGSTVEQIAPV